MSDTYAASEVSAWLEANLPTWSLDDGYLTRTYTTRGWQLTLLLANAIGYLAEAAWHHPELILSYPRLTVRPAAGDRVPAHPRSLFQQNSGSRQGRRHQQRT
jgi:4a-hydroxytetrahydrobiopterin dehydratase